MINRTYVAGPMSGYHDHNFPAFDECARALRSHGASFGEVVSPAELTRADARATGVEVGSRSWAYCMRQDLREVLTCSDMVLLDGWASSRGARLEVGVALAIELRLWRFSPASCDENHSLRRVDAEAVRKIKDGGLLDGDLDDHLGIRTINAAVASAINVALNCDRCGTAVPGSGLWKPGQATAGWYHRAGWARFMDEAEVVVCDACMWKDPRYLEVYGPRLDPAFVGTIPHATCASPTPEPESVAAEADRIVSGDRMAAYGHPFDNWTAIADLWQHHLDTSPSAAIALTAEDAVLMMILMKVARLESGQVAHRDSKVDIAGYAKVLDMIVTERRRRETKEGS